MRSARSTATALQSASNKQAVISSPSIRAPSIRSCSSWNRKDRLHPNGESRKTIEKRSSIESPSQEKRIWPPKNANGRRSMRSWRVSRHYEERRNENIAEDVEPASRGCLRPQPRARDD